MLSGTLFVVVGSFLYRYYSSSDRYFRTMDIVVGGEPLRVWIADTPEKRQKGLMGITALPDGRGMIFLFPEEKERVFWNKNTLVDLDVLWIADGIVAGVMFLPRERGEEPVHVYSLSPVDTVLEVPAGWVEKYDIGKGDEIIFGRGY